MLIPALILKIKIEICKVGKVWVEGTRNVTM